jgi:urease gamma subunit
MFSKALKKCLLPLLVIKIGSIMLRRTWRSLHVNYMPAFQLLSFHSQNKTSSGLNVKLLGGLGTCISDI